MPSCDSTPCDATTYISASVTAMKEIQPIHPSSLGKATVEQDTTGNHNQTIGQVQGGMVVYVSGGQAIIHPQAEQSCNPLNTAEESQFLPDSNPYRGLLAFQEADSDRYFGRSREIQSLYKQFNYLQQTESAVRLLPIYGASGCGKSSLVRAGLLPEIGRRSSAYRVALLVPGSHPLQALASILARIALGDTMPVRKTREFAEELALKNEQGNFDGLFRIASALPNIAESPLIVVVDQFEEIYSLTAEQSERHAFINNLLYAAAQRASYVSIVLTCRSDFIGKTHSHPTLNRLLSEQGFLVPVMDEVALKEAIEKPAQPLGVTYDQATVSLLIEQTIGHEGALPLLQFALTRIWEERAKGKQPIDTLTELGGVGGALAHEAQQLYESLSPQAQQTAKRIFLRLVRLSTDSKDVRRRATLSELIAAENGATAAEVKSIIQQFSAPRVRFLSASVDETGEDCIEVTHEALIHRWEQLQSWLSESKQALMQCRKIETAAQEWDRHQRSKKFLLEGHALKTAKAFRQTSTTVVGLSSVASKYLAQSMRQKRRRSLMLISGTSILPACGTLVVIHYFLLGIVAAITARVDCHPNTYIKGLLSYQYRTQQILRQQQRFKGIDLCGQDLDRITLENAQLEDATFTDASLNQANLKNAVLTGAKLDNTEMLMADLREAMLLNTDFRDADLESAKLHDAYLEAARFNPKTDLTNTRLYGADLSKAIGLSAAQVEVAKLCDTQLPATILQELPAGIQNRDCLIQD